MVITGMRWAVSIGLGAAIALANPAPVEAQSVTPPASIDAALAEDAVAVAPRLGLSPAEAVRQLHLQSASVAITDAIADRYTDRLAGISVGFGATFGIVVLLTGDRAVSDEVMLIDGNAVTVTYRTGARSTRTGVVQAITAHQAAIRASLLRPPGMGFDPRTGELVIVVSTLDVDREGAGPLRDRLAGMAGVPVRLRIIERASRDLSGVEGGMRAVGSLPGDPRRYQCTTGFVVTDGMRSGIATAAHCPDTLGVRSDDGQTVDLPFVGQWGWGYQDVQINVSATGLAPVFRAAPARPQGRTVSALRSRSSMRGGDVVCHRGQRTGYSCSQVELTDFAPAGDLCGGACLPTWTTVAGPSCRAGDSGSPVFLGSVAHGLLKGGSYRADGSCAFYFYMSTDYIPIGWRVATLADHALSTDNVGDGGGSVR